MEMKVQGVWRWEVRDAAGRLKARGAFQNGVTTAGLTSLLDVGFRQQSQLTWYVGLISGASAPTLAAADTMASHAGWTEITDYDEANRPAWGPAAASAGVITNSAAVDFTISASVTVAGFFLASNNTKGGTSGTLWATGTFDGGNQALADNDVLHCFYELTLTAA